MNRRRFLAAGVVGAAALACAGWWASTRRAAIAPAGAVLSADAKAVVRAIVPAMLGDALPAGAERATAVDEVVSGFDGAVAGLPPFAQGELGQLFSLLSNPLGRRSLAGLSSDCPDAPVADVVAFLERWRDSGWALKRGAFQALHQLVAAAWYGNPRSWKSIGYDGPPRLRA